MSEIAFVTCQTLPEPDVDEPLLLEACQRAELSVTMAAWDDPKVDWTAYSHAILRSTWNYYEDESAFRTWLAHVAPVTNLINPPKLVIENLDKTYLNGLSRRGIPVVPTCFPEPDQSLSNALAQTGWRDVVVKPTVSAGSFMTQRFRVEEAELAEAFLSHLRKTHRPMVQPYLRSVESGGEVSLIHIDGELTHAITKQPRFAGQEESVSAAQVATPEQADIAKSVMASISEPWLYARVDLIQDDVGNWNLSELEAIEPSLFFLQYPPALDRFVSALARL